MQKTVISAKVNNELKQDFEALSNSLNRTPSAMVGYIMESFVRNPSLFGAVKAINTDAKFGFIFEFYTQSKDHFELAKNYLPKEVFEKWEEFLRVFKNHIAEEITDKWLEKINIRKDKAGHY